MFIRLTPGLFVDIYFTNEYFWLTSSVVIRFSVTRKFLPRFLSLIAVTLSAGQLAASSWLEKKEIGLISATNEIVSNSTTSTL